MVNLHITNKSSFHFIYCHLLKITTNKVFLRSICMLFVIVGPPMVDIITRCTLSVRLSHVRP